MQNQIFKNKTLLKILDYYKNLWALSYAAGIAHWDLETYMPEKGASARGEAMGRLSVIRQKMFLQKEFVDLIHQAEKAKNLNDYERGVVRVLLRSLKFYEKVPSEFIEEFEKLTNQATVVWREAKAKNNYPLFAPYLVKIFAMNRKMAEYLGYQDSPYDALLDLFEEGLTSEDVSRFFGKVTVPLRDLLRKILSSPKYSPVHKLEKAPYDRAKMEALNKKVLQYLWADEGRLRLDTAPHPFSTSFSVNDTRITTWYHKRDFGRSLLALVHEFGHALYDLQSAPELEMTPIAGGSSLVIHESQSRFWENFVGRSKVFIEMFLPDIRQLFTSHQSPVTSHSVYSYFNKVAPGPLRVEADEVTYHLHVALRFEIEKGVVEGRLKVEDLRGIWNAKMKEYLGITPKSDAEGILQDIHWSGGSVGYFPTYSLGTFLGAQWESKIKKQKLKIKNIQTWLREHIHRYGSTYTLSDLLKKNKMRFDPNVNLAYLQKKYAELYNF